MQAVKILASLLVIIACISIAMFCGHSVGDEIREAVDNWVFWTSSSKGADLCDAAAYMASKLSSMIVELVITLLAMFGIIKILLDIFF